MKYLLGIFIISLLLVPADAKALTCNPPNSKHIVRCENNNCSDGFILRPKNAGKGCQTYLTVKETDDVNNLIKTFLTVEKIQTKGTSLRTFETRIRVKLFLDWCDGGTVEDEQNYQQFLGAVDYEKYCNQITIPRVLDDGIYELSGDIRSTDLSKVLLAALASGTLIQISDDASLAALSKLKEDFITQEKEELKQIAYHKWMGFAVIVVSSTIIILWPWLLWLLWKAKRKNIARWLRRAIIPQVLLIYVYPIFVQWAYRIWHQAVDISIYAIYVTLAIEVILGLIVLPLKAKQMKPKIRQ